ncbi:glycosyltransferase [Paracoccus aminophilus]|uniref:Glycosyl transferase n=1 Tax=Paracoccus aminophilus JCM 7686 TaxID=1367847 RepID=S5XXZ0_PARAH|nr:glycosyltransferase [Paracoccus aminophilus]AGT10167.1 glycosyl transferase [Paracoccus aminophilus JCM 7686]
MHGTTENTDTIQPSSPSEGARPLRLAAIAIGRNEGERLVRCLTSLLPHAERVIYVDSGSTDGSRARATELGAEVIALDMTRPFTAARARNAGLDRVGSVEFVQFVDGDCEVDANWIPTALAAMSANPDLAVAAGRRRERFPEASIYNRICDIEWNTPIGPAQAVGGDMLARREALVEIGGYDPSLIAGEEPEMCLRLARAGWQIERLDAEMTLHDAAMTRFSQWWKRSRRAGHAFAEVSWRYRDGPEGFWRREARRPLIWAGAIPLVLILVSATVSPWALLGFALYPIQIARLALGDPEPARRWGRAFFNTLGKLPEAWGVAEYHIRRLLGRRSGLIEYK